MENIQQFLTGRDTDLLILAQLNDKDLLNVCLTNKSANRLCNNENFWKNRLIEKYGEESLKFKSSERSYKNFYLNIIKYLDKYKGNEITAAQVTALSGIVDLFEFFFNLIPAGEIPLVENILLKQAAEKGNEKMIQYFIAKGFDNWESGFYGAVKGGNLKWTRFFLDKVKEDYLNHKMDRFDFQDLIEDALNKNPKLSKEVSDFLYKNLNEL